MPLNIDKVLSEALAIFLFWSEIKNSLCNFWAMSVEVTIAGWEGTTGCAVLCCVEQGQNLFPGLAKEEESPTPVASCQSDLASGRKFLNAPLHMWGKPCSDGMSGDSELMGSSLVLALLGRLLCPWERQAVMQSFTGSPDQGGTRCESAAFKLGDRGWAFVTIVSGNKAL